MKLKWITSVLLIGLGTWFVFVSEPRMVYAERPTEQEIFTIYNTVHSLLQEFLASENMLAEITSRNVKTTMYHFRIFLQEPRFYRTSGEMLIVFRMSTEGFNKLKGVVTEKTHKEVSLHVRKVSAENLEFRMTSFPSGIKATPKAFPLSLEAFKAYREKFDPKLFELVFALFQALGRSV